MHTGSTGDVAAINTSYPSIHPDRYHLKQLRALSADMQSVAMSSSQWLNIAKQSLFSTRKRNIFSEVIILAFTVKLSRRVLFLRYMFITFQIGIIT